MKKTLALAIVLASVITSAQTETTTAPAATQPEAAQTAPVAKSKVKKAKKKKSKAGAANEVAAPAVNVTVKEAGLPATQASAAKDAGTPASANTAAAAAGTTTTAMSDVAAPQKKLKGFINVYSTNDAADTTFTQTLTSIGGSYKFADKLTLKIGETFETLAKSASNENEDARNRIEQNNFRASHLDVNVGTTLPGLLGSNDQTASLTYRAMGSDAVYTTTGGYAGVIGMYEANLATPFVINTKWDVNVVSQVRHVVYKGDPADSNRILVIPYLTYTINDVFSVYQAGGMIFSLRDNMDLRRRYERVYLETGFNIAATKNLTFSFDVSQDKAIQSSDANVPVSNFSVYSPNYNSATGSGDSYRSAADNSLDAVAYEGYITYSF